MVKRTALFVLWGAISFVTCLEVLYAFTPIGLAGLVVLAPAVWLLDRKGLDDVPVPCNRTPR